MQHYKQVITEQTEGAWDEGLAHVGEMYFGIKPSRQSNPLMDMMGAMFGGGGGGGGAQQGRQRVGGTPAPQPALD